MSSKNVDNVKGDATFIVFFWGGAMERRRGNYRSNWHLNELAERAVASEVGTLFQNQRNPIERDNFLRRC